MSCYRDLNSGPLPYQGSALPLSYNSEHCTVNDAKLFMFDRKSFSALAQSQL